MAATLRTWVISAAAATGVVGGGAIGIAAAAPSHDTAGKTSARQPAGVDTTTLQAQVRQLLAEDQALHAALAQAKARLSSQVATSEASVRAVRAQLAAAEAALAAARQATASAYAASHQQATTARTSQPATHTTTGASGASGSGAGTDGGHDD